MNITSSYKFKQLAHKRSVWILLLSIWLFSVNTSLVHAQEHLAVTDYKCQFCITNFSHSPFLLSKNVSFTPIIQDSFIVQLPYFNTNTADNITIGNRDPPH